jgi:hypothetical protein
MMFCLMFDVMFHGVAIGTAYAECAVSFLPSEIYAVIA